jgi:hypothetical protein
MAQSAIRLISRNIFNLDSAIPTDWLLANVGDKIRIETTFSVENIVIASTGEMFVINNKDGYIEDGWLTDSSYRFINFKVGDKVHLYNHIAALDLGEFTIVEKRSDGELRLDPKPAQPDNTDDDQGVLSNKTPISSIKYHFNFVENASADSFLSVIDGNEQLFTIDTKVADDVSLSDMKAHGPLTYQESNQNIKIQGVSIDAAPIYKSTYKVIHYTQVTPYILYEQLENQIAGLPHKDFELTKCWKLITKIEAAETFTNPNYLVSETFSTTLGNSGWYNENFNTGITKFKISNLTYTNSGKVIDAIQFDETETLIEFDIDKPGASFTNGQVIRLGFFKVPYDPGEYQNNNQYADINFLLDGMKILVGNPEVTGLGSIYRSSAKIVSPTKIKVSIKIHLKPDALTSFSLSAIPRYFIFAALKDQIYDTLNPLNDHVSLQVAFSAFYYVTADPGMIVIDKNVYLQHPDQDPAIEGTNTTYLQPPYTDSYEQMTIHAPAAQGIAIYFPRIPGDPGYGEVIGIADWQGNAEDTISKLIDSINDRVAYGSFFGIFTALVNPGFTATYAVGSSPLTFNLIITSPAGSQTLYNGKVTYAGQPTPGLDFSSSTFFGGVAGTKKTLKVFPEDEIVACTNFFIERSTRELDDIRLTSVEAKIIATNGTDEFDLDRFPIQLASVALTGDTQQFDITIKKPYHIPDSEPRKIFNLKRRNDLDAGSKKYFSIQHPFMWRWEYWEKLMGGDPFFFDANQPNNGLNHFWKRYSAGSWKTQYQLVVNATKNGIRQQYKFSDTIIPTGYGTNGNFTTRKIELFDPDTLVSLFLNNQWNIPTDKKTLVVATFINVNILDQCTVRFGFYPDEEGGQNDTRTYSSRWVRDGDTWYASTNDDGLIDLVVSGNTAVAKCLIDNNLLQKNYLAYSISARIYEYGTVPHRFLTNDEDTPRPLTNDNGDNFIL